MRTFKIISIFIASLFLLYTLIGFFFVPYLITDILPSQLQKDLNLNTSFKKAKFNPFTFFLNIKEPALLTEKNNPIFTVKNFSAQLNPIKLFTKNISLENVGFVEPKIYAIINKKGEFNFFNLVDTNGSDNPNEKSDKSSWNFDIKQLSIQDGNIIFTDKREAKPFTVELKPINYQAKNIGSIKNSVSSQKLSTKSDSADDISLDGTMGINPFKAEGLVNVKNLKVEKIWNYGIGNGTYYPQGTTADISFSYIADTTKSGLNLAFNQVKIALKNTKLFRQKEHVASLGSINLDDFKVITNIEKNQNYIKISQGKIDASKIKLLPSTSLPLQGSINAISLQKISFDYDMEDTIKSKISAFAVHDANITLKPNIAPYKGNFKELAFADLNLDFIKDNLILAFNDIQLKNSNFINSAYSKPFLRINKALLDTLSLNENNLIANILSIDNLHAKASLDKDGNLDIVKNLTQSQDANKTQVTQVTRETNTSDTTFTYTIKKVEAKNSSFAFQDNTIQKPFNKKIDIKALDIANISSNQTEDITLALKADGSNIPTLTFEGNIIQKPLHIKGKYSINYTDLSDFQGYIDEFANLLIKKGSFKSSGKIDLQDDKKFDLILGVDGKFTNIDISKNDKTNLLSWKNLDIQKLQYHHNRQTLKIHDITLDKPKTTLIVNKNGTTNYQDITNEKDTKTKKKKSSTFDFAIDNLSIANGDITIKNKTLLSSKKDVNIEAIKLNAKGYNKNKQMKIDAKATINKTGYLSFGGKINPNNLKQNTDFKIITKGINLPSLDEYTKTYLGQDMKAGRISTTITQTIRNGKVNGSNHIRLSQVALGKTVQSKKAVSLPLEAAILLLRDSNGDVDLDIPINGDLNDPNFSYASIIVTAITNVVTGIVTAPFSILGSILGIDGEKLKTVDFEPSSTVLVASEAAKMNQYAKILEQKEKLKLTITGGYNGALDFQSSDTNETDNLDKKEKPTKEQLRELADKRANIIKETLIQEGIKEDRIIIKNSVPVTPKNDNWISSKIGIEQ